MFSVSSDSAGYYEVHHVEVRNWMGLDPFWAQILTAVGGVLGPMLTIPWWLERRKESEQKSADTAEEAAGDPTPTGPGESAKGAGALRSQDPDP